MTNEQKVIKLNPLTAPHLNLDASALRCALIVPTKNRPYALVRLLRAVLAQSTLPTQVVIVDQSDTGEAEIAVRRMWDDAAILPGSALTYIRDPAITGAAHARNVGIPRTTEPVVVFCDDDAVPMPNAMQVLIRALAEHPELVAAGGIITSYCPPPLLNRVLSRLFTLGPLWDERQPIYWNWRRWERGRLIVTTKLNGGLMAIRRSALDAVGGFDPAYRGPSVGEDIEISRRLMALAGHSHALALVGGAWLEHESLGTWKDRGTLLATQFVASHYIVKKTGPGGLRGTLLLCWLSVGLLAAAVVSSIRRRSLGPVRLLAAGWGSARHGYRDCLFLQPHGGLSETRPV
jgi:GT2 family glycosyltransferase